MKAIISIWKQPIYSRLNQHGVRSLVLLLAAVPVIAVLLIAFLNFLKEQKSDPKLYAIGVAIGLGGDLVILFYGWFLMLLINISLQYSPANAGLVPHMKRNVKLAVAIPILLTGALITLVISLAHAKFDALPFFSTLVFMSLFAATLRNQMMVIPFVLTFQIPVYLSNTKTENPLLLIERVTGFPLQVQYIVLGLLTLYLVLVWLFSVKDDAHFKMYERAQVTKSGMQGSYAKETKMSLGFAIFYFYGMRKAVARVIDGRNARETHQLSRYVFGPRTNWTTMLMQVLVMSVFAFVFLLFISVITGDRSDFWNGFGHGFGWAFAGMFLLMQPILYLVQIFYALYKTRREQALVSLTPGVGLHLELHDVLISYIWRQFLILYALSFVLTLAFVFSFDKFDLKASALVLLLAFMFPCSLALTVNFGRMKNQNDHSLLKWLAFAIGGFIISISSLMFVPFEMSWGIFGVMMVGTLLLRQKRSKGQLKSTNFPVGRAAN